MVARYRSVLSSPGCARLFATALLARLPQGMSTLAILLLVRSHTGSYAAAGVAVGAFALATATGAPMLGRLVDRFGRRRVLVPAALAQAVAMVALVLAADDRAVAVVLVVLAGLCGGLLPPIAPTVRALLREMLDEEAVRETAYSLESVIQELIWITGPLLVAVVIAAASPAVALLFCAAVCVLGTLLFVASPLIAGAGARPRPGGPARSAVLAIPQLRALIGPIALTGAGLGAIEVGLPSLALHAGSRPEAGLLLALWSAGSMTGGLWYGSRAWRAPLGARYRRLLLAGVALTAPLIFARTIPEGIVFSLLAGLTTAPVFACQYSLIGHAVTPGIETEAFTWVSAALIGGLAAGSALGGTAIGLAGVGGPFVLACAATGLAAASALRARAMPARGME
ncbi:MAG: MFS transporter, partial [Solirubrobacteraceae bacterium]